ncbi:hypothetical protein M0802_009205 [Mischocyttarus mexicanus]|nr:hypothetical protein M0802_009205 [Mischocyttarus mexicanus]
MSGTLKLTHTLAVKGLVVATRYPVQSSREQGELLSGKRESLSGSENLRRGLGSNYVNGDDDDDDDDDDNDNDNYTSEVTLHC